MLLNLVCNEISDNRIGVWFVCYEYDNRLGVFGLDDMKFIY